MMEMSILMEIMIRVRMKMVRRWAILLIKSLNVMMENVKQLPLMVRMDQVQMVQEEEEEEKEVCMKFLSIMLILEMKIQIN